MLLDDLPYKSWLHQLQTWAADGRLLTAALDALKLKPGQATQRLKRIVERLAKGDRRDLPPIEMLPGSAMPGAAGAYAKATKTIYINKEWIKSAKKINVFILLTEEFGHHLDNQLKEKDTPGDEGAIFSKQLFNSYPKNTFSSHPIHFINGNDHGWISVNGQRLNAEFQVINGTSGNDTINGTGPSNTIYGYGGNDTIGGGGGADYIYGGGGADRIYGKTEALRDTFTNYLFGGEGNDTLVSGVARDILRGDGNQVGQEASTNDGNDWLQGNGGSDLLTGGNGNDLLDGGAGQDRFEGGPGADIINGGGASNGEFETVYQHDGDSTIWTNAGNLGSSATLLNNETITFGNGTDVIYDFNHSQYHLYLPNNSFNLLSSGDSLTDLTIGQNYFIQGSWSYSDYSSQKNSYQAGNYSGSFTTGESTNWNEDFSFIVLYNAQSTDFFSTDNTNFLVLEFDYNAQNTVQGKHPTDMVAGINGTGGHNDLNPLLGQKILINGPSGTAGDSSVSFALAPNTLSVHTYSNSGNPSETQSTFWSLAGGADASLFTIDNTTGELKFINENSVPTAGNNTDINSDGIYEVHVMASVSTTGNTASERAVDADSVTTWQSLTLTVDTIRPTIAITDDDGDDSLGVGDTATITFTLSEASSNFIQSDVTVSGGSLTNFSGSGTSYSATFTPTNNSTANGVISVASGTFTDTAGNANTDGSDANNIVTFSVDTTTPSSSPTPPPDAIRPTIAISDDDPDDFLAAGDSSTLNFTLSEPSTDFLQSDVSVSGGTLSNWTAHSSSSYSASFSPSNNSTADGLISVASGAFSDAAGNTNNDGSDRNNSVRFSVDTAAPSITVAINDGGDGFLNATEAGSASIAGTTSGAGDGQTVSINISSSAGGTPINTTATTNSNSYSLSNLDLSSLDDGTLTITADVDDRAGNSAAQASDNTTKDTTAPTITVAINDGGDGFLNAAEAGSASIAGTTSGAEDGQTVSIAISSSAGGTPINTTATTNSNSYSLSNLDLSSLNDGTLTITADVDDRAGNSAAQAAETTTKDTTAPAIASIGASPGWIRTGQTNTIHISLTESSKDFTLSDISAIGGTLSNWNPVSNKNYKATFTPQANRTSNSEVSVANFSFSDKAGNFNNNGSKSVIIRTDTVLPEITLTANKLSLSAGDQAIIEFELSKSTSDFNVNDLTVTGGSISNFTGSGKSYTAVFTPDSNSITNGVVSVASSKFSDSFGNFNKDGSDADNRISFNINTDRPTIAIRSDQDYLKAGETAKITFILSESSTDFTLSDIDVTGGTLAEFSGAGDRYSAIFQPDNSSTDAVVSVGSGAFSDAAGNTNNDDADPNNSVTFTIDTVSPTIAISDDDPDDSLAAGHTSTLTFTLSEPSTNFLQSDVSISGGTLSNWTAHSSTSYSASFTPNPGSTTDGVISVGSDTFSDLAGNANNDGSDRNNTVTFTVDSLRPSIAISGDDPDHSLAAGETSTLNFTLSEPSTDFLQSDVSISGGTLSHWTAHSSSSYSASFTPNPGSTTDGLISVGSAAFSDSAGNTNNDDADPNNSLTFTVDTVRPTIAISGDDPDHSLTTGETSTLNFTLSEPSTDFLQSDVAVSGGTLSNWSAHSSTSYSASFTPNTGSTTDGVISVGSAAFSDLAGNANIDGSDRNNTVTFTVDTTAPSPSPAPAPSANPNPTPDSLRPSIAISDDDPDDSLAAGETSTLSFRLSEPSTDFLQSDVAVSGGSLSNWTADSSSSYTASFTPSKNSTTDGVLSVASGVFSNSAGNTNNDDADPNNSVTFTIDTVRPTIAISNDDPDHSLTAGETSTLTFSLSEPSTDFLQSDVSISGGTLSNWSAHSSTSYSASFTPNTGSTTHAVISVGSAAFSDLAGNANIDGSDRNNSVRFTIDSLRPTIAISDDDPDDLLNDCDSSTLTFRLSEPSTDFLQSDVSISGGTLSHWTAHSSTSYTASFTPNPGSTTDGLISVGSAAFSDLAGNTNNDDADPNNSLTFTIDSLRPTIAISNDDPDHSLTTGETSTLTFTLSEPSTDFLQSDVSISGGTLSNWTAHSSTSYTASFTPNTGSTTHAVISVGSAAFSDLAGNANIDGSDRNNTVTLSVDTTTPSPSPSANPNPTPDSLTPSSAISDTNPDDLLKVFDTSTLTSFSINNQDTNQNKPLHNNSDIYLLLDTSTSMHHNGGEDRRKFQSLLALEAFTKDAERAGYQFQRRNNKTTVTATQLLQTLASKTTKQAIQELDHYTIIDNPNDAKNADNLHLHLITYNYHVKHNTFTLYRTNPNSGIGTMQAILSLKMAGEQFTNSLKNNTQWKELGLPKPNRYDLYQGHPDKPSNLYAGTELLGALEGLDYLLTNKANDPNQRNHSTTISLVLHGRPERRSWWDTRTNAASDSIIGQAIPLPESLGKEDITTSGLLYDNNSKPHYFKNNQGQWQWKTMQNDLNTALDRLADHSSDPAANIQVNAFGLDNDNINNIKNIKNINIENSDNNNINTGNSSLADTYQDLFSNQIFNNSSSSWSYTHQTIQSLQDINL